MGEKYKPRQPGSARITGNVDPDALKFNDGYESSATYLPGISEIEAEQATQQADADASASAEEMAEHPQASEQPTQQGKDHDGPR